MARNFDPSACHLKCGKRLQLIHSSSADLSFEVSGSCRASDETAGPMMGLATGYSLLIGGVSTFECLSSYSEVLPNMTA